MSDRNLEELGVTRTKPEHPAKSPQPFDAPPQGPPPPPPPPVPPEPIE